MFSLELLLLLPALLGQFPQSRLFLGVPQRHRGQHALRQQQRKIHRFGVWRAIGQQAELFPPGLAITGVDTTKRDEVR